MAEKVLHVVGAKPASPPRDPPRKLGQSGADLWAAVTREYAIDDAGGIEMLLQACEAADRAAACAAAISLEGETVRMKGGPMREHPLLKHELSNRAFIVRTLSRLGLDVEPVRAMGRPPTFA